MLWPANPDESPVTRYCALELWQHQLVTSRAKQRLGQQLGSAATSGEGAQNLLCAYMAAGVLLGLVANAALGWWWLDPVIALGIAGLAIREGIEAWRGEVCDHCAPAGC